MHWSLRRDDLAEDQASEIDEMMAGAAGVLLMMAGDRNQDIEDGIRFDRDSMAWDEYLALRVIRDEVKKAMAEKQAEQP